jgi:putative membrane protein insertion efficiency factor
VTTTHALRRLPARGAIFIVELYRAYVSPMRLPTCRFMPTCSQYAVEAIEEYGLIRGGWLAGVRLLKCGPWHKGGWDPIPERRTRVDRRDVDDVWGPPTERGESRGCVV